MTSIFPTLLSVARSLRTRLAVFGRGAFLRHGNNLHVGEGCRLWAPHSLVIGSNVYIGKQVNIEANCEIGDFCLIANRVAIIGRNDHDYSAVGFPMRYAPHVSSKRFPSKFATEKAVISSDVWLGYGVIVLTGVTIGKGSVIAAGSVVTRDIPPYSIAAGIPAKVVATRFSNLRDISLHESAIANGKFALSERGFDACTIEPALGNGAPKR